MSKIDKVVESSMHLLFIIVALVVCGIVVLFMDSFYWYEKILILPIISLFVVILSVILKSKYDLYKSLLKEKKFQESIDSKKLITDNPLEKYYTKEELEQLDSASEELKRKTTIHISESEWRDLTFDKK